MLADSRINLGDRYRAVFAVAIAVNMSPLGNACRFQLA